MKNIWVLLAVALAACGGDSREPVKEIKQLEKIQEQQKTFRKQVFLYIDDFNQRMRNANIDASIAGTSVHENLVSDTPSMHAVVNPSLKIEWLANTNRTDIRGLVITQDSKMFSDNNAVEHFLINCGLLAAGINMTESDSIQLCTTIQEYLRRLVEMHKFYEEGDPPQKVSFEFKGYKYILGFGGQYVFYSREIMNQ
ncbi:hypothetical protein [Neisseria sp. S1]|uniref:hypothetical protein n=1 Tax=Neisseria sp. S1 TaxID=3318354 RepID=UPI003A88B330